MLRTFPDLIPVLRVLALEFIMIYLDFESRSRANLPKCGASAYAMDPSTQVLCAFWAIDNGPVKGWHRAHPHIAESPPPEEFLDAVSDGHRVEAHNAGFERAIVLHSWHREYRWAADLASQLRNPERWRCSAARAASFGLPRSLDGAAMALRLTERKDPEGKLLIHLLCKPQKDGSWAEDPDPLEYLWDYCAQDVVTERAVSQALIPLIDDEQRLWEADCRMNERGFSLDARFAREALSLVDEEKAELNAELYELTLHHVERGTQRARFIKWADYMGVHLSNTKKETVTELLESGDRLPKAVRRGLEILRTVNMTSVTKFKTALVSVCDDGRLRDTQMFHGANTGRWTGKGIQPHNLPRGVSPVGCEEMALDASLDLEDFRLLHGSPTEKLSAAIRGLFVASKGLHLFVADYSAIEARVLCWLAGQEDAVELFRRGDDVYMDMAASVYACELRDVDSDKRFVGKQAVLGLGYGMGATKFSDNVRMLGLRFGFKADMPLGFYKSVVDVYRREKYQQVAEFWGVLERAAIAAVREGGMHLAGDKLALAMRGRFLRIRLPSGRMLSYAEPMLALRTLWYFSAVNSEQEKVSLPVRTKRGEAVPWVRAKKTAEERGWTLLRDEPSDRDGEELTYMTARGMGAWIREGTYGGKLAENVTQAVARDVLAGAILRADADYEFHKVLLTVHDEIICEAPPNTNIARFARLVGEPPEWAPDLPVDVEPWHGPRYGKA